MKLQDYAELEQPRPESKETDAYWKKKPKPKKVKKKRRK